MKTTALALTTAALLATGASATPILTTIIDGPSSTPKGVEVYLDGSYDGYAIEVESNGGSSWNEIFTFDTTVYAAGLYFITSTDGDTYVTSTYAGSNIISDTSFNQNGNDALRILDASDAVVDQFGDPSEVAGSSDFTAAWVYNDSWASRVDGTGPDGGFVIGNWTFGGSDAYDQGGSLGDEGANGFVVPEPTSLALLGLGGLLVIRRRKG